MSAIQESRKRQANAISTAEETKTTETASPARTPVTKCRRYSTCHPGAPESTGPKTPATPTTTSTTVGTGITPTPRRPLPAPRRIMQEEPTRVVMTCSEHEVLRAPRRRSLPLLCQRDRKEMATIMS